MGNALAVKKKIKRAKQVAQGTPQTAGSQYIRRTSATFRKVSDTYQNAEIVDHMQSTGATEGTYSTAGKVDGLLSPATYAPEFANLIRAPWTATPAITGMSITIAASGQAWTITRAAGDFLVGGIKALDVIRLPTAAFNAANKDKNLFVLSVTATVLTVIPLNGVALVAEGPIAAAAVNVPGKKCWALMTGHSNDFFTWEVWNPDVPASNVYQDCKVGAAQIQVPASGNPTVSFDIIGLGRTSGTAEVLTAPTAATTTSVLADAQGKAVINGVVTPLTSININVSMGGEPGAAEIGSQARSGIIEDVLSVSGSFTAKFSSLTLQAIRDNQNVIPIAIPIATDNSGASDFICMVMPAVNVFTDDEDDGKEVIKTYNFTAKIPATGGAALANWQAIFSMQDSQA